MSVSLYTNVSIWTQEKPSKQQPNAAYIEKRILHELQETT